MLDLSAKFASVAQAVSAAYGGPYYDALILTRGEPVYDSGGSILTQGVANQRDCEAQVDAATQDMLRDVGFTDGDVRILVLSATLSGSISLDDRVKVLAGPHAGEFLIQTITRDPFGIYFELRGRPA